MEESYMPVKKEPSTRIPRTSTTEKSIKNIPKRDDLYPTHDTFDEIQSLASQGYSIRSIAYLMGVTMTIFDEFREKYSDKVLEAIAIGRVIDETECMHRLRTMATSSRSANPLPALKLYREEKFGAGSGASDLPRNISFSMIEPEDIEDNDAN